MDETDDVTTPSVASDEVGINDLLGFFSAPAFVRRGHDVEYALISLHRRLERERSGMLDMVRVRLKQWAAVATGPDDWQAVFQGPIASLYSRVTADVISWSARPATARRRHAVARDLVASVDRFNRRWLQFLTAMKLDAVNRQIEQYNLYYVLEKECVVGSSRLAARHFVPKPLLTIASLLADHPTLAVPALLA